LIPGLFVDNLHPALDSPADTEDNVDMPRMNTRTIMVLPIVLLFAAACASGGPSRGSDIAPSEPLTSLDRFLGAADDRDLVAMGYLFGTMDGPVANTGSTVGCGFKRFGSWLGMGERCRSWQEVELRLDLIATILEHDSYEVIESRPVAGKKARTTRFTVDLVRPRDTIRAVPFELVQAGQGRWLVEYIDLEKITGG
jgi:hypothetical protein